MLQVYTAARQEISHIRRSTRLRPAELTNHHAKIATKLSIPPAAKQKRRGRKKAANKNASDVTLPLQTAKNPTSVSSSSACHESAATSENVQSCSFASFNEERLSRNNVPCTSAQTHPPAAQEEEVDILSCEVHETVISSVCNQNAVVKKASTSEKVEIPCLQATDQSTAAAEGPDSNNFSGCVDLRSDSDTSLHTAHESPASSSVSGASLHTARVFLSSPESLSTELIEVDDLASVTSDSPRELDRILQHTDSIVRCSSPVNSQPGLSPNRPPAVTACHSPNSLFISSPNTQSNVDGALNLSGDSSSSTSLVLQGAATTSDIITHKPANDSKSSEDDTSAEDFDLFGHLQLSPERETSQLQISSPQSSPSSPLDLSFKKIIRFEGSATSNLKSDKLSCKSDRSSPSRHPEVSEQCSSLAFDPLDVFFELINNNNKTESGEHEISDMSSLATKHSSPKASEQNTTDADVDVILKRVRETTHTAPTSSSTPTSNLDDLLKEVEVDLGLDFGKTSLTSLASEGDEQALLGLKESAEPRLLCESIVSLLVDRATEAAQSRRKQKETAAELGEEGGSRDDDSSNGSALHTPVTATNTGTNEASSFDLATFLPETLPSNASNPANQNNDPSVPKASSTNEHCPAQNLESVMSLSLNETFPLSEPASSPTLNNHLGPSTTQKMPPSALEPVTTEKMTLPILEPDRGQTTTSPDESASIPTLPDATESAPKKQPTGRIKTETKRKAYSRNIHVKPSQGKAIKKEKPDGKASGQGENSTNASRKRASPSKSIDAVINDVHRMKREKANASVSTPSVAPIIQRVPQPVGATSSKVQGSRKRKSNECGHTSLTKRASPVPQPQHDLVGRESVESSEPIRNSVEAFAVSVLSTATSEQSSKVEGQSAQQQPPAQCGDAADSGILESRVARPAKKKKQSEIKQERHDEKVRACVSVVSNSQAQLTPSPPARVVTTSVNTAANEIRQQPLVTSLAAPNANDSLPEMTSRPINITPESRSSSPVCSAAQHQPLADGTLLGQITFIQTPITTTNGHSGMTSQVAMNQPSAVNWSNGQQRSNGDVISNGSHANGDSSLPAMNEIVGNWQRFQASQTSAVPAAQQVCIEFGIVVFLQAIFIVIYCLDYFVVVLEWCTS